MYKILIRCVLDLKMEKGPLAQERYLFIYRKICLGFSSQMGLVPCLMGLARGSRSTPNSEAYGSVLDRMNQEASVTLDRTNGGRKRLKVTLG